MKIRCEKCGHKETTNLRLFVRIIGGAMPLGGFWAWTAYLLAGTGFAMQIVIAIIAGGTAMLLFQNEIVTWIMDKGFKCPKCGASDWKAS